MGQQRGSGGSGLSEPLGQSEVFLRARDELLLAAKYDISVLIEGETGTGKEMFARYLHSLSARRNQNLVAINCAAIPPELAESEFFGHKRGAFTHAHEERAGLVAQADKGSLFLDEISSMDLRLQAKLLRFIQEREYRRVGGDRNQASDVRIIAACNDHLETEARQGRFRWDLFYRLAVFPIKIPPLRERSEDILLLLQHFFEKYERRFGLDRPRLRQGVVDRLLTHSWPGNVRELENLSQWLIIRHNGKSIETRDLPPSFNHDEPRTVLQVELKSFRQRKTDLVTAFECGYLRELMQESSGNVSRAAKIAGKNRRVLTALLKKYEIDPRLFRNR